MAERPDASQVQAVGAPGVLVASEEPAQTGAATAANLSHSWRVLERAFVGICAVAFLCVLLWIVLAVPHPTPVQEFVFRILLALAAGGFAAFIPGFFEVTVPRVVRAGGAAAMVAVVFFFNPPRLVSTPQTESGFVIVTRGKHVQVKWLRAGFSLEVPRDGWVIEEQAAREGLGDLKLVRADQVTTQLQMHFSRHDQIHVGNWAKFAEDTTQAYRQPLEQYGPVERSSVTLDGRAGFRISAQLMGQQQKLKEIELYFFPSGSDKFVELHYTRNAGDRAADHDVKQVLDSLRWIH
jgi:hypothetical protein